MKWLNPMTLHHSRISRDSPHTQWLKQRYEATHYSKPPTHDSHLRESNDWLKSRGTKQNQESPWVSRKRWNWLKRNSRGYFKRTIKRSKAKMNKDVFKRQPERYYWFKRHGRYCFKRAEGWVEGLRGTRGVIKRSRKRSHECKKTSWLAKENVTPKFSPRGM